MLRSLDSVKLFRMTSQHLLIVIFTTLFWEFQYCSSKIHADAESSFPGDVPVDYEEILLSNPGNDILEHQETSVEDKEADISFEKYYIQGIRAYEQHIWYSCAENIEKAIAYYKEYKVILSNCRLDCSTGIRASKLANITSSIHDFSHFVKILKDADCFRRCKDETLTVQPRVSAKLEDAFVKRVPYQYLQFCYFKLDRLPEAASAAYTFYLANPDDVDTKQNIVYYRDKAMVPETDFIDMELVPYKEHYIRSTVVYKEKNWRSVIVELEASLEEYFKEHERCHSDCQGTMKTKGGEFSTEVADMILRILICRLDCEEKLSIIFTEPVPFFLQTIYHYLQIAYYEEENLEKSVEVTASFLVLNSSNAVMKDNKELLKERLGYSEEDFVPREDVVKYASVRRSLRDLMNFLSENYRWPSETHVPDESSDVVPEWTSQDTEAADDWMTKYEKLGVNIIAKSVDLHKEARFVTDGLLKDEQCEQLLTLTKDLKIEQFSSQKFDLKLAQQRLEENPDEEFEAALRLFIRATEIVSHYTQRYLGVDMPLYLQDAQIVCWSQFNDHEKIRNCFAQEDGTCVGFDNLSGMPSSDAYTTVTYLSTVEDGDFQFLNEIKDVDSSFGVKCGRTVGFKSGDYHAVKVPSKGGHRCALLIRFVNHQSAHKSDYQETITKLHKVDELRFSSSVKNRLNVMKKFEEEGVKIVRKGDELMGKERFVADGLANEAQCITLKNMVQSITTYAENYSRQSAKTLFISPHTEHELHHGITVYRASKLTHQGLISTFGLRAFLDLSEKSRLLVEKYFNLTKPLYFDYTHLVCRTAIDETNINRDDLSHPVHADNCVLQPDGSCLKEFPAFTQRDYSALLYLNADFEGGEFFFAHSNTTEQVSLRPKCGRLVGFNAGEFHGVRAVRSGQRCALALWFTMDATFKELAHIHARKTLKRLEEEQKAEKAAHEDL